MPFSDKAWCSCLAVVTTANGPCSFSAQKGNKDFLHNQLGIIIFTLFIPKKAGQNRREVFNWSMISFILIQFYPEDIQYFSRWHCKFYLIAHFKPCSTMHSRCSCRLLTIIHLWRLHLAPKWHPTFTLVNLKSFAHKSPTEDYFDNQSLISIFLHCRNISINW